MIDGELFFIYPYYPYYPYYRYYRFIVSSLIILTEAIYRPRHLAYHVMQSSLHLVRL